MRAKVHIALFLSFAVGAGSAFAGDPGSAGLISTRLGVGGRSGAMGETGAASAFDASAVFWNPGSLAFVEGTEILLQHSEYMGLFRKEGLAVSHATEWGTFGLLFGGFYTDGELDRLGEIAGVSEGTFQPYDVAVGMGYARQVGEFGFGVSGKFLYERIDLYSGSGFAVDAGISHRSSEIEGLAFGASVQNLGPNFKLEEEEFPIAQTWRLGGSYRLWSREQEFNRHVDIAADFVFPNDGNGRVHYGAEWQLHEVFALRGGYRQNYESYGVTAGAGFSKDFLSVDYAWMESRNDLDSTHRFSLSFAR